MANSSEELLLAHQATLKDLVYENEDEVKARITSELQGLGAAELESRTQILLKRGNSISLCFGKLIAFEFSCRA